MLHDIKLRFEAEIRVVLIVAGLLVGLEWFRSKENHTTGYAPH